MQVGAQKENSTMPVRSAAFQLCYFLRPRIGPGFLLIAILILTLILLLILMLIVVISIPILILILILIITIFYLLLKAPV